MIKVFKIDDYNVDKHNDKFRRGFIIPLTGYKYRNSVLNVTDSDSKVDHEKIADNFIYATDEQVKEFVLSMGIKDEETFKDIFDFIKGLQNSYQKDKEKYSSSRKDYLIYEQDTIAYDSHSNFGQGAFVIYREQDKQRRFYINPFVEKIVWGYAMKNWKIQKAPKDPQKVVDDEFGRMM